MNPDRHIERDAFQQAWQAESSQTSVTINTELLTKALQSNQQEIHQSVILENFGNIAWSVILTATWIYMGVSLPGTLPGTWTWWLMIPVFVWSIGLTLFVRSCQRQMRKEPGKSLVVSAKESLALVEHQIWWKRKYFWWCSMPGAVAMQTYFTSFACLALTEHSWTFFTRIGAFLLVFLFTFAITFVVYWVSFRGIQQSVRKIYEPKRLELLALLESLDGEVATDVNERYPRLMNTPPILSRGHLFLAFVFFVAIMLFFCILIISLFNLFRSAG